MSNKIKNADLGGLSNSEYIERELLLKLQKDLTRFFSQQDFDRLKWLSNKMFANSGSPHIEQKPQTSDHNRYFISRQTIREIIKLTTHELEEGGDVGGDDIPLGTMDQLIDRAIEIIKQNESLEA
jgi:hypothetical protein